MPPMLKTIRSPTLSAEGKVARRLAKLSNTLWSMILNHRDRAFLLSGYCSPKEAEGFTQDNVHRFNISQCAMKRKRPYSERPGMAAPGFRAACSANVLPVAEPDRGTREGLVGGSAATGASNRMLSCRVVFCHRESNNGADITHFIDCFYHRSIHLYTVFAFFQKYFSEASSPLPLTYSETMRKTVE